MNQQDQAKAERIKLLNLTIVGVLSQVGLLTVGIILAAVVGGMFLDSRLGTKPWFTVGLIIASVPISLVAMVFVARAMARKIKPEALKEDTQEDRSIGN